MTLCSRSQPLSRSTPASTSSSWQSRGLTSTSFSSRPRDLGSSSWDSPSCLEQLWVEEEDSLQQPQRQGQAQLRDRGLSRQQWELPCRASNSRQRPNSLQWVSNSLQWVASSLQGVPSSSSRGASSSSRLVSSSLHWVSSSL